MAEKQKIRPLYSQLQGYLSQGPNADGKTSVISDPDFWNHYNKTIDELNDISGNNYDHLEVQPIRGQAASWVPIQTYRSKLGGLISRLHGQFFSDEPAPFGSMPSTIIRQSQQQTQSFQIQMLLEIQSTIDEKIRQFEKGSKEQTFLQKVKSSLASIANITQLVALLLKVGHEVGLTIEQIAKIFS